MYINSLTRNLICWRQRCIVYNMRFMYKDPMLSTQFRRPYSGTALPYYNQGISLTICQSCMQQWSNIDNAIHTKVEHTAVCCTVVLMHNRSVHPTWARHIVRRRPCNKIERMPHWNISDSDKTVVTLIIRGVVDSSINHNNGQRWP